ncbi:cytoplasmic protein [Bacillus pseudomycoides]|nr:cytoplasmic protein [Bacillus pseudomycoides]
MEIRDLSPETSAAGVGSVEERKTLGTLFSVAKNKTKGTGNRVADIPPAFKQEEFASTYEGRRNQTPLTEKNKKVGFEGLRGESLCTLKPPPDPGVKRILDGVGVKGIQYKNGVPDFSPVSKAQVEIDHMYGGTGSKHGNKARRSNFAQANEKLAEQLNKSPELASKFGMKPGNITKSDIEDFRLANNLTWHELNDVKTMQLVPSSINSTFGHLGGVGEINAGAYTPEGFATK